MLAKEQVAAQVAVDSATRLELEKQKNLEAKETIYNEKLATHALIESQIARQQNVIAYDNETLATLDSTIAENQNIAEKERGRAASAEKSIAMLEEANASADLTIAL